jgi:predicted metal-dependent HD superfamily phosphohydrolase
VATIDEPHGLRSRWVVLARRWGALAPSANAGFEQILARYAEPARRYHTIDHVAAVLATIEELAATEPVDDLAAVQLAGWLHDVVYDPTRPDNEAESARYARRSLSMIRVPTAIVDETARLIELTAGHEVGPDDRNGRVLVDADLSILGAPPDVYDRYAADIRAEYAHVDDGSFRAGRRRILEQFAERPQLFHTATARARFEEPARANLARELVRLG